MKCLVCGVSYKVKLLHVHKEEVTCENCFVWAMNYNFMLKLFKATDQVPGLVNFEGARQ